MNKKCVVVSLLGISLIACSPKGEEKKPIGNIKELIDVKCSACHFSSRIFDTPQTAERWVEIVNRMRALNPEMISEEEATEMIKYLQANNSKKESESEPEPEAIQVDEPAAEPESVPGSEPGDEPAGEAK